MLASQLAERVRLGEDSRTEMKSVAHGGLELDGRLQQVIARSIVAFANGEGGLLIVGVEDDGTPTGTGDRRRTDKIFQQITQLCHTRVEPALYCHTLRVELEGQRVITVEVPAWSPNRPYRTDGKFYLRDGATTREATHDELVRMLQSRAIHLDESPVLDAARADLDEVEIERFLKTAYKDEIRDVTAYLRALKCLEGEDEPTVTGVLFFGREPHRFFPDARITAIRFPGTRPGLSHTDRKELTGTIFRQMEAAQRFLADHVPSPSVVEGWTRREQGIPVPVLREALQNALAHRDYNAASQTRIFVFDDRVEIINPGMLLNRLTVDSIKLGGITQRRTPAIAALLARAGGRENAGLGVPAMFEMMREAALPEPEIDLAGGHFRIVLRWGAAENTP